MADRVAVVTGVSKGLGEALAVDLVDRGFEVVGIGRAASPRLGPPRFRLVAAELADTDALPPIVDALFAELAARSPAAIAVVNNAATGGPAGTIGTLEARAVGDAIAVNLVAPIAIANAFVRAFRDRAGDRRLINVSSGAAVRALPGGGTYCIAKAGLEMLTAAIAAEEPASGITAITIRPGIIDTPMQAYMRSQPADRLPSVGMFRDFHASGQLVPPAVVAAKIVERLVLANVEPGRVYSYAEL